MPTEPGWYLDPESGQHRYWNGTSWAAMTAEEEGSEAVEKDAAEESVDTD